MSHPGLGELYLKICLGASLGGEMAPECHGKLDLGSTSPVLEFWLRIQSQDSNYKKKFIWKVTEVGKVSQLGMGFGKKAKDGTLELRKEKGKGNVPGGKKRGRGRAVLGSSA